MLHSAESEKDILLEETSKRSLKNASRIQKYNNLLDQALAYIHLFDKEDGTNSFLETDKLLRVSGSNNQINQVFNKMMGRAKNLSGDPSIRSLLSFDKFIKDPNNVIGLIKYGLSEIKIYWPISVHDAFRAFVNDPSMPFENFIQRLLEKGAIEEAKVFHNLLYLFHRIYHFHAKNNMHENEIFKIIAEPLTHFSNNGLPFALSSRKHFGQTLKFSQEQLTQGEKRLVEAIKNKYFEKNFTQRFPVESASLVKLYQNDTQFPILTEPMKMLGFVIPHWLSDFLIKYFYKHKKSENVEQTSSAIEQQPQPPLAQAESPIQIKKPESVRVFEPEPSIIIEPEPVKKPLSSVQAVEPEPIKKFESAPIRKMEPEPIKKVEPEPIKKMEPEPIKKVEPEPIRKIEPEPIKKVEPEPIRKIEPEPIKKVEPAPIKKMEPESIKRAEPERVKMVPEPIKKAQPLVEDAPLSPLLPMTETKIKEKPKAKAKPKAKSKEIDEIVKKPPKDRLSQLQDKFIMMNRPTQKDKPEEK
ncbi:MAG: hypothetical protein HYX61_04970 [Gammaproteobacteria bacterium]|nr:hypothetical protein [Gammaproteobacteria bacterium]